MNKKMIVYFLALILKCSQLIASNENIFKHYTSNHGLTNNTVFSIVQDADGFMWFGTGAGLSRFNGKSFTTFQYDKPGSNAFLNLEIQQLTCDPKGNLWILSEGKIARFDKSTENFNVYGQDENGKQSIQGRANSLYNDGSNFWLCTSKGLFCYNYDTETFEIYTPVNDLLQSVWAYSLLKTTNGKYWLVTLDGIYVFDDLANSHPHFIKAGENNSLSLNQYKGIVEGTDEYIYIGSFNQGVVTINKTSFKIETLPKPLNRGLLRSIAPGPNGTIWIGTELGVSIYNPKTKEIEICQQNFNNEHSLNDNAIYSLYKDKHDNMWVGTYFGGVNVKLSKGNQFVHYKAGEEPYFLSGKAISQIVEDAKGNLWIGTEDEGLNYFDPIERTFRHFQAKSPQELSYVNVHALYIDRAQKLWIGTFLGGLNVFENDKFTYFRSGRSPNSLPSDNIYAINGDENGNIWIGSTNGLSVFDNATNEFIRADGEVGQSLIYAIYNSKDSCLWVATLGDGLFYREDEDSTFRNVKELVSDTSTFLPDRVIFLTESSDGLIWFGTVDDGLFCYDKTTKKVNQFTKADGLPDNTIYTIIEDDQQNLWLTSNNGLIKFNRSKNYFRLFTTRDGLPNNQFNYKAGFRHSNGTIYLGSVDGLIAFNPNNIQLNSNVPEVKIYSISLFNKPIIAGQKNAILSQSILDTKKITLEYDQNVIGFEFTAIDYTAPETNQFTYKMEGLESSWNNIGNYNSATFSQLPPGVYTFKVKASNNDGIWNEEGTSIQIVVNPPYWLSPWAYLLYIFVLLFLLWLYRRYTLLRAAEKTTLAREKMEKEKLKEINQLKLMFYTNVSHEFRTPLSLIIDPLSKLADDNIKNPKIKNTVSLVLRNAQRMQILVNQLLDFRKAESGQFHLTVSEGNLIEFVEHIYASFLSIAVKKNIDFTYENKDLHQLVWFDNKLVDIILYNLLSNAFKFTPVNGKIELKLIGSNPHKQSAIIQVSDSGMGISKNNLPKVFERFYQIESKIRSESGSGIGLALAKNLTELHHGRIWVESQENIGTHFFVEIPVYESAFQNNEQVQASPYTFEDKPEIEESNEFQTNEKQILAGQFSKIMIIEDNLELQNYARQTLGEVYKTETADNGKMGWERILEFSPDIIISDVMMPEMDGYELCEKVKTDLRTSHIPVILLTAKSGINNQTEGLKFGADIYIEKPFNSKILMAQIDNLIKSRERYKKRFESELGINISEITNSSKDEEFLKKAIGVIFNSLNDSNFNTSILIDEMAVSRTLLHTKLKKITGKSASEFIQYIKIKEAARMLQDDKLPISEVAYRIGFNDPSYFSKCFKKQIKVSPKEYQQMYSE